MIRCESPFRVFHGKIILLSLLLLFIPFFILPAFDISIRLKPYASFPMGDGNTVPAGFEMYNTGGGGDAGLEIDLSTIFSNRIGLGYTMGIEGGMMINPFRNESEMNVNFYSGGGLLGLYFYPLSRLLMRFDAAAGISQAVTGESGSDPMVSMPGMYYRYGGELGFRFTPGFLISANAGWRQYQLNDNPDPRKGGELFTGTYAGLTAQLTFHAGNRTGEAVSAIFVPYESVYPAFMQTYKNNPIGNIVISNNENAEIRDVRVSFRAGDYTSAEFRCGTLSVIPRGRRANVPLLADFSNEILRFTGSSQINGEIIIRYKLLGQERTSEQAITVAVHDRNRVAEGDAAAFVAFISPTAPETLEFARAVMGLERLSRRTGHNPNLSYATWLLETIRASQFRIANDQLTENRVQFPSETLLFRSGTSRDLALLYAACLAGVGIGSAFIQTESELLVAVSLGVNQSAAETLFNGTGRIIIVNDTVWLPLSMNAMNDGFMAAWNRAVTVLNRAFATGGMADFAAVEAAWGYYPPALMYELGRPGIRIDNAAVSREVNRFVQLYITQELNPIIQRISAQTTSAVQQNRLGILFARAGRIPESKTAYERAANMGSVAAMTNRGNLALAERDFATAQRWFNQALAREPQNAAALRGLERVAEAR